MWRREGAAEPRGIYGVAAAGRQAAGAFGAGLSGRTAAVAPGLHITTRGVSP